MMQLFIRIYYEEQYFEYNIDEKRTYLNVVNKDLFIYYDNSLVSNFILNSIELNKKYYYNNFYYMIGKYSRYVYVNKSIINIKAIINTNKNIIIDLQNNKIIFNDCIYISNILYEQGCFYFSNNINICVDEYEFSVINNMFCFRQQGEYKDNNYFIYYNNVDSKYLVNKDYSYKFDFLLNKEVFKENVFKYLITPLIMLCIMIILTFVTKRYNMIIFMLASTISSLIGSIYMYYRQKSKIEYHNKYVDISFKNKFNEFKTKVYNDLIYNYKNTDFKLKGENVICFGYLLKNINVDINISNENYKNEFTTYVTSMKYYNKLTSDKISIIGKYSYLYLYNLLMELHNKNIIFIGNFDNYSFLSNAMYYEKNEKNLNFKNNIIICNTNENLNMYEGNNTLIFIDIVKTTDILTVNSLYLLKYNNDKLYVNIESNYKILFLKSRKIIFDKSTNCFINGVKLCSSFCLDIEKHGLIVGMTGSGKSVLLLLLILQICKNYSTDEAVIGIIDFKGSALISKVKDLPHISSLFSNLNGGYENIIESIKFELQYRQELFNKYNISEYSEIKFKLPRLFIFIDEFAELRKNLNEISSEIESIARIGRSLGVYLIISLQKSSGVVSEQLRSNIGYNICLRVNSKQDSMEVVNDASCAYFSTPGQAIVSVDGVKTYIEIFNCLSIKKDDIIVDGVNNNNVTYLEYEIHNLSKIYKKTKYVIWKSFPTTYKSGIVINSTTNKKLIKYKIYFNNYLIVGKSKSGKSELIKTIISDFNECIVYLGNDSSFINIVDIYIDNIDHIKVYISYMKLLNVNCYFIIDNYELYSSEVLFEFVEECLIEYYKVNIIVTTSSIESRFNRIVKYFNNKFMLSVNDPNESYNLFYKKTKMYKFEIGQGLCVYNNKIVEFKNYLSNVIKSDKKYNIFNENRIVYLNSFQDIDYNNSLYVYEYNTKINKYFFNQCYYKEFTNYKYNIITSTRKFEYNYRNVSLITNMLYDVIEEEDVIAFCNLNCM